MGLWARARGRFNAWGLAALDGYLHRKFAARKQRLLHDLPPAAVELGSGSGTNFRYLPRGLRLVAVEPNVQAHGLLKRRAERYGLVLELHAEFAEHLALPSDSVEFVFCSLVLCSVRDPSAVIAEVRRVLKPGGRFVCLEHVAAEPHSRLARWQRLVRRPWHWAFDGCDVCRDTGALLRAGGFSRVDVTPFTLQTFAWPIRPIIEAVCVK
ncbi:MAG TPA: class I SAM-dependent methyltransferase [Gemmatimonadaceae bacterium]|nr:class I SAM-dependent methyltransferase [Gemmatimonadaceae bacterium]